jgi:hypothetical protein
MQVSLLSGAFQKATQKVVPLLNFVLILIDDYLL